MTETLAPAAPRVVRLADYRAPVWLARRVDLFFDLHADHARVAQRTRYELAPGARMERGGALPALVLDGAELELVSLALDGRALAGDEYVCGEESLTLRPTREAFTLEVVTRIEPQNNTRLSGLYRSRELFCTQMEAEGFRRVTWWQDRPDVLSHWTVTLEADQRTCPVLLSNGNPVAAGSAPADGWPGGAPGAGRHRATWVDPFAKPSYLFALVAGDLEHIEQQFTTASGGTATLRVWVEHGQKQRARHALQSLARSIRWDEQRFGRELDLELFQIVAVSDFNSGAMENKGLNIFNDALVLAEPATATDRDYQRIEGVVGHEYFHNWSGNRVTCRDWFQLSLKEGFTVYRDQEFSSDVNERAVKRIEDVRRLRSEQFPEDAGPMAHPVRPESYMEIDNFYTRTVYEKGSEVVRMLATLLGERLFRAGCDLYFERHDGQAVTVEDFVAAMEAVSGRDFTQFRRWYSQAGTPRVTARGRHDAAQRRYELRLSQHTPPTPGQPHKQPFVIPVAVALLARDGRELPGSARVIELREAEQRFVFENVEAPPVPSLLRSFSAPVHLETDLADEELALLVAHDRDGFVRWDAVQRLATRAILAAAVEWRAGRALRFDGKLTAALEAVLDSAEAGTTEPAVAAELLALPPQGVLGDEALRAGAAHIDVEALHAARQALLAELSDALHDRLLATQQRLDTAGPYSPDAASIGRRALKNTALALLMAGIVCRRAQAEMNASTAARAAASLALCVQQFQRADNMTDQMAALELLACHDGPEREEALSAFRTRWAKNALVLDKWLAVQAGADRPGEPGVPGSVLADVRRLATDPLLAGANPNRMRALWRTFSGNVPHFHARDGSGYRAFGDMLVALDPKNPVLAARLAPALNAWRRMDPERGAAMRTQLQRLLDTEGLSRNTWEVASLALA